MDHALRFDTQSVEPEVRSYIYQVLMEFEPYTAPTTNVSVIAKDPVKGAESGKYFDLPRKRSEIQKMSRISITLTEGDTKIEAEAMGYDIYSAIRQAKDNLLAQLAEIHDSVVSNSERNLQIISAQKNEQVH